jgi:hypothetical protein
MAIDQPAPTGEADTLEEEPATGPRFGSHDCHPMAGSCCVSWFCKAASFSTLVLSRPVDEQCVSQPSAYREYSPLLHVLHGRDLAEPLHDGVVMHDDRRFEFANRRNCFDQTGGKIETRACPIAGKVLSATVNRPVRLDLAWAANTDKGRKAQLSFSARAPAGGPSGRVPEPHHPC